MIMEKRISGMLPLVQRVMAQQWTRGPAPAHSAGVMCAAPAPPRKSASADQYDARRDLLAVARAPVGTAYVNGRYVPRARAVVAAEDRGFLYADAVYEVMDVRAGALVDGPAHTDRLWRGLAALGIAPPMPPAAFLAVVGEVLRRSRLSCGALYIQVTRGAAPRSLAPPEPPPRPTLVVLPMRLDEAALAATRARGKAVITTPDLRWARRDIKTTMLLPACLALAEARAAGAQDAWLLDAKGCVTEATSANAWIVYGGVLRTRPEGADILKGVTRTAVLAIASEMGLPVREVAFTADEARAADEAFQSSSGARIVPVVRIDGRALGGGVPGPHTQAIARRYDAYVRAAQDAGGAFCAQSCKNA
jgi:D-alanine transaminase